MKIQTGKIDSSSINPGAPIIEPALKISVLSLIAAGLTDIKSEETTTGAFLGLIASNMNWLHSLHPNSNTSPDQLNWVIYQKSGSATSSEAWTGSDFALLIKISESKFRAAAFQAKRMSENNKFNAVQISPARADYIPEPQIIRQVRYSQAYKDISLEEIKKPTGHIYYFIKKRRSCLHALIETAKVMQRHDLTQSKGLLNKIFHSRRNA